MLSSEGTYQPLAFHFLPIRLVTIDSGCDLQPVTTD
jgi:hypothetical protein